MRPLPPLLTLHVGSAQLPLFEIDPTAKSPGALYEVAVRRARFAQLPIRYARALLSGAGVMGMLVTLHLAS